jgi:hypothetical protein
MEPQSHYEGEIHGNSLAVPSWSHILADDESERTLHGNGLEYVSYCLHELF